MKELYNKNNLIITLLNKNYYMIESNFATLKGYCERINDNSFKMRLDYWKDNKTKRVKTSKNKLFNHTCNWFSYILQKYTNI